MDTDTEGGPCEDTFRQCLQAQERAPGEIFLHSLQEEPAPQTASLLHISVLRVPSLGFFMVAAPEGKFTITTLPQGDTLDMTTSGLRGPEPKQSHSSPINLCEQVDHKNSIQYK